METIQKMYCPSCGAPVSFESGREDTFCSHCGSQLYFKDEHLQVKLKHEEAKLEMEYADKKDQREFEIVKEKARNKEERKNVIFGLGLTVLIYILGILYFRFC